MRRGVFNVFLIIISTAFLLPLNGKSSPKDFHAMYRALKSDSIALINEAISKTTILSSNDSLAYSGALQMKKAGLLKKPGEKLEMFRTGKNCLEQAISRDTGNVALRFLRLIIQENSPAILGYRQHIESDKTRILNEYNSCPSWLQEEILNYSKTSKVISPVDLQQ